MKKPKPKSKRIYKDKTELPVSAVDLQAFFGFEWGEWDYAHWFPAVIHVPGHLF